MTTSPVTSLRRGLAAFFSVGILAGAAEAATLTIDSTSAAWDVTDKVVRLAGEGTNRISWGRRHPLGGFRKSAYRFDGAAAGTSIQDGEIVTLGAFQHNNFTIRPGRNLKSANLDFDVEFTFNLNGAEHSESLSFDWLFSHDETNNNQKPICADGNLNGVGVNRRGCADHVVFTGDDEAVTTFTYAEGTVTLQILGFVPNPEFWTVENRKNVTQLGALFTFTPTPPPPVPLPAAGWMVLAALGGLGSLGALRRRQD